MRSVRDGDANSKQWQKNKTIGKALNAISQTTEQNSRQIQKLRRRIVGGGGGGTSGWYWESGSRLYGDPTVNSYSENQVVKILESDSIVTTGIVCEGSSTPVTAVAGKWVCVQDVPVLLNNGHDNPAYIPTLPIVSGSGDPDNSNNYWELITPSNICVNGATTAI
jgi:hypothetical protein